MSTNLVYAAHRKVRDTQHRAQLEIIAATSVDYLALAVEYAMRQGQTSIAEYPLYFDGIADHAGSLDLIADQVVALANTLGLRVRRVPGMRRHLYIEWTTP